MAVMFECALDASSHVKASEPTFLERDLQPSGSCRAEPHRAFSTLRLLEQGLIVNKSSILTDSRFKVEHGVCGGHVEEAGGSCRSRSLVGEEAAS